MTRERIEDFREIVLPFLSRILLKTNHENMGKSDAEEFEKDFNEILDLAIKALEQEPKAEVLNKIRSEIEQLPTNTRTNWDGCCPDIDYPEIEYVDIPKKQLLDIIDKYMTGGDDKE